MNVSVNRNLADRLQVDPLPEPSAETSLAERVAAVRAATLADLAVQKPIGEHGREQRVRRRVGVAETDRR